VIDERLFVIINNILAKKGAEGITPGYAGSIVKDLDFDSFDLAEFNGRIEEEFGVDPFEGGYTDNLEEIAKRIRNNIK